MPYVTLQALHVVFFGGGFFRVFDEFSVATKETFFLNNKSVRMKDFSFQRHSEFIYRQPIK